MCFIQIGSDIIGKGTCMQCDVTTVVQETYSMILEFSSLFAYTEILIITQVPETLIFLLRNLLKNVHCMLVHAGSGRVLYVT